MNPHLARPRSHAEQALWLHVMLCTITLKDIVPAPTPVQVTPLPPFPGVLVFRGRRLPCPVSREGGPAATERPEAQEVYMWLPTSRARSHWALGPKSCRNPRHACRMSSPFGKAACSPACSRGFRCDSRDLLGQGTSLPEEAARHPPQKQQRLCCCQSIDPVLSPFSELQPFPCAIRATQKIVECARARASVKNWRGMRCKRPGSLKS